MRLITHNMLQCRAKGVTDGYPLKIVCSSMEVVETEFDRETVLKTLRRINFDALKKAAKDLNIPGIPESMATFPLSSSLTASTSTSASSSSLSSSLAATSIDTSAEATAKASDNQSEKVESVFSGAASTSSLDSGNSSSSNDNSSSGSGSGSSTSNNSNDAKAGGGDNSSTSTGTSNVDLEALLRVLHHLLFEVHVLSGALVCPSSGRSFPIVDSIPNMLLHEDEV